MASPDSISCVTLFIVNSTFGILYINIVILYIMGITNICDDSLAVCSANITANPARMARSCQIPRWLLPRSRASTSKKTTYRSVPAAIPWSTVDVTSSEDFPLSLKAIPIPIPDARCNKTSFYVIICYRFLFRLS